MALFGDKKKKDEPTQVEEKQTEEAVAVEETTAPQAAPTASHVGGPQPADMIIRPRITEKATLQTGDGVYVFDVAMRATKEEIKKGIEAIYKVTPRKVNIVKQSPQKFFSRMRNRRGMKSGYKKAYVYLKEGDRIDII